jgi:hypothetical protein
MFSLDFDVTVPSAFGADRLRSSLMGKRKSVFSLYLSSCPFL